MKESIQSLWAELRGKTEVESLRYLAEKFAGKIVFSTSFGLEDQIITHLIYSNKIPIQIFSLETGRLFKETLALWQETEIVYSQKIKTYFPDIQAVDELVAKKGMYSFYESVENRKECCHIRKVVPLQIALKGQQCWITGIRSEQSSNRTDMQNTEWDSANEIIKFHPIFDWSWEKCRKFVQENLIPYNLMHDKGFPSIGCEPCTKAIKEGEDFRAGRWWWEQASQKECGLHSHEK
ncbi:MAG: phosphoadenylyl-sulfate reductase [Bacteroidetes bacterium]|nr:MAG: phosphoadenylyl-sulfate reductase [Bacteroidota bacterium]